MKNLFRKKTIYTIVGIIPLLFISLNVASAQQGSAAKGAFSNPFKGSGINSVPDFLDKLIDLLINFGAVIVVFFVVFAGFQFVMAQGNPEKIKKAKDVLMYTLIGAAILLGAKVISEVIKSTVEQFIK